jgi:hypothetical protein
MAAVVRLDAPAALPAVAYLRARFAPADEHRLRGAAPLEERQIPVDELVVVDRHAQIVGGPRDSSGVAPMTPRATLFDGRLGSQRVIVWLDDSGEGGIQLGSHDIGRGLEAAFGRDEIETYLTLGAVDVGIVVQRLATELGADVESFGTDVAAAVSLLARRYSGDSAATTHLRLWLDQHLIPYEFNVL